MCLTFLTELIFVQGLHVIKAVVDLKGMKRFKKKDGGDVFSANDLSLDPKNT